MMRVSRQVSFCAYHSHRGMMSEPLHLHEFSVRIDIAGELNEEGFVCDFRAVKRLFKRLVGQKLDGRNLDELFDYATSEVLAVWIWNQLKNHFPLHAIEVKEKANSSATYYGS